MLNFLQLRSSPFLQLRLAAFFKLDFDY